MFAVAEIRGVQYRVEKGDVIALRGYAENKEKTLTVNKVLLLNDGKQVTIGTPYIKGASVNCDVLRQAKGKKKVAFKFRRREQEQTKIGHRDKLLMVRVKEINNGA